MTPPKPARTIVSRTDGSRDLLSYVKRNSKISYDDDDDLIVQKIRAAIEYVETVTNRVLFTTTYQLAFECFPSLLPLSPTPVASVVELAYTNVSDVQTVMVVDTDYRIEKREGGFWSLVPVDAWPTDTALKRYDAVTVQFTAGTTRDLLPPAAVEAIALLAGHWYEHRETTLVGTISKQLEFSVSALCESLNLDNWITVN
ncbi:MAG: head-tail connector protein [Solirubrobacterales bacterium]